MRKILSLFISVLVVFSPIQAAKTEGTAQKLPYLEDNSPLKAKVLQASNEHWAFSELRAPQLPIVSDKSWVKNPIDLFTLKKMEQKGRKPAKLANPYTLIRRAHFDLLGLPPAPDLIRKYLDQPNWTPFITQLLDSPHYGERYARHWLDVARYADSSGYGRDYFFPHAARYRDYVIESFNKDKAFNTFIKEQIAGDLMYPNDKVKDMRRHATGLYTIGSVYPVSANGIKRPKRFEYDRLTDAADVTGEAFLGLSFGCARCHNHKYDPISQYDYFALQSFFASTEFYEEKKTVGVKDYLLVNRPDPVSATLFKRGELDSPLGHVRASLPRYLSYEKETKKTDLKVKKNRLHLANWIASDSNPLTARVIANRVWQWHFGKALVTTPNDFGLMGKAPSNPELLDYLANYLVRHDWSLKKLHLHIMSSSTYRMSHSHEEPETDVLDRFPRIRMQAETIWDNMLSVSGKLNKKMFGASVFPPVDKEWLSSKRHASWPTETKERDWMRRGIYVAVKRSMHFPFFDIFDGNNSPESCGKRDKTVISPQALTVMNGAIPRKLSEAFLKRLLKECGQDEIKIMSRAWMLAYGRPITEAEEKLTLQFIKQTDLKTWCHALFNSHEFIYFK